MPSHSAWKTKTHGPWILERLPTDLYTSRGANRSTQIIAATTLASSFKLTFPSDFGSESDTLEKIRAHVFDVWRDRDKTASVQHDNAIADPTVWIKSHLPAKPKYVSQGSKRLLITNAATVLANECYLAFPGLELTT